MSNTQENFTQKRTYDLGQTRRALSPEARKIALLPHKKALSTTYLALTIALIDFVILSALSFDWAWSSLLIPFGFVSCAYLLKIYSIPVLKNYSTHALKIIALGLVFLGIGLLLTEISLSQIYAISLGLSLLLGTHLLVTWQVKRWFKSGELAQRVVVVGGGFLGAHLIQQLLRQKDTHILGFFDDRKERSEPNLYGVPNLGNIDDLLEFSRLTRVDSVIVSLPMQAEERIMATLDRLWVLPVAIRIANGRDLFNAYEQPLDDFDIFLKGTLDRVLGAIALVLLSPLMALVALAIRLESQGQVLFKQRRYGFNNQLIEVYKFRSMYANQKDIKAIKQATKDDPRITRVGRFIRKTSLDELPQLFNVVFKGNLSLVGPRPHPVSLHRFEEVTKGYFARHKVKPGMTGLAQIKGWRGETDTDEKMIKRVEYDLEYIENWSLWLDLKIMALTPYSLLKETQGAY